uniref:Uncharacterized protein n=1 Tax=Ditylenchus dipsaci TaxID=166011 RepID=A0A915D6J3_9BILA
MLEYLLAKKKYENRQSLHKRSTKFGDHTRIAFVKILDGASENAINFWEFGMTFAKNFHDHTAVFAPLARPQNAKFILDLKNEEYSHECNPERAYFALEKCEELMNLAYRCTLTSLWDSSPKSLVWHTVTCNS